jgi:hypothetical protein
MGWWVFHAGIAACARRAAQSPAMRMAAMVAPASAMLRPAMAKAVP